MVELLVVGAAFACAAALTGWMRGYAVRRQLLDVPNIRSSHEQPTPRGGGISIVVVALCVILLAATAGWLSWRGAVAVLGGGFVVAVVGHLDDRGHVPACWRLLVHVAAGAWAITWLAPLPPLPLPSGQFPLGLTGAIASVVWIAWILNLYNFMDGIDGIAAVEAVTVAAGAAALLHVGEEPGLALTTAAIGASALGFLVWNWPPARIFMGDVGSGFLGYVFGTLALVTHVSGTIPLWAWLILLGVFLVDATVTLLRRLVRRERLYEAHRSHAYQHAARRFQSHRAVTIAVAVLNALWLFPLALAAMLWPRWGLPLTLIAWAPLLALAVWLRAGSKDDAERTV